MQNHGAGHHAPAGFVESIPPISAARIFRAAFMPSKRAYPCRAIRLVIKASGTNGRPAVKLSDNPQQALGVLDEIARYQRMLGGDGSRKLKVTI